MTKMKNGLMMFCLTVLLSCAALMMNTPTASAMTLQDLQGDYRIVAQGNRVLHSAGCIVSFKWENGELIGTATKVTQKSGWKVGQIIMQDVYVDNGVVYCQFTPDGSGYADTMFNYKLQIFNNGKVLKVADIDDNWVAHELHRL